MLTLLADQPECLWDDALPVEVKELPADLAALDVLLADHEVLWPLVERWHWEFRETGRLVLTEGRPTIPLETFVRLMVLKQRYRWGYRTLVAEVSDSIHLRRFCRISLSDRVPDESTVRKLTRRIGAETVAEMTRALIVKATREKRFRPRAVRIDSTVIEADIKHPTDAGLASVGVRALAREGRKLARLVGETRTRVRDRSRAMGQKLRGIARTIRRRSGEAKGEVLNLTKQTGELLERSITEARRLAALARRKARGRGARSKLTAARRLEELTDRCEKVARQVRQRIAGEKITDRIVSLTDPDARPIRKGKIGKPTEFGYVSQLAEMTEHTKTGARGLILPASARAARSVCAHIVSASFADGAGAFRDGRCLSGSSSVSPVAIVVILEHKGDPERLMAAGKELAHLMPHPDGVLVEAIAPTEDGILLVHIWESEQARAAWAKNPEHRAALKASGIFEASQSRASRAYETDEMSVFGTGAK